MSAARDSILHRIRAALGDAPPPPPASRAFRRAGTANRAALVENFSEKARSYRVRVERCGRPEAAATIARLLGERGAVRLVVPTDLPAAFAPQGFDLVRDEGLDRAVLAGADGVLTTCACAIAQTGTIVLDHGAGQPLFDRMTVIDLIANTTTTKGLTVACELDPRSYQKGIKVPDEDMRNLNIQSDEFHPEWNYSIMARSGNK